MRRLIYTCLLLSTIGISNAVAQNVFDVNDPDWIFTTSDRPSVPPVYNNIYKWGHSKKLNWNPYSYGYKSYIYKNMAFRLKFPKTYQQGVADGKKYPVYVFLHGAGEPGDLWDNELHLVHGGQLHAQNVDNGNFDGFLIYPQSQTQFPTGLLSRVVEIIDSLAKYAKADVDRVTLGGLSSGGTAVYSFLQGAPKAWASITPISSSNMNVDSIKNYLSVPIWISNGGQDKNPPPSAITRIVNKYKELGGDVRQNFYPDLGHGVWNNFWSSPGYFPYLNAAHKAQPVVKFQHSEWCPGETIHTVLILQPDFYQYEWQKDGVTIPGADKDSLVVSEMGEYRARFKRTASSDWSDWSPRPVNVKIKQPTVTPPITIEGMRSNVLPAPDGSTTVPITVPEGYETYEWRSIPDNTFIGDSNVVVVPVGQYKVRVTERFGCSSDFSPPYDVIAANGTNVPDPASGLTALAEGNSSIHIFWNNNPNPQYNETWFEVYRSKTAGSNYKLIAKIPADSLSLMDEHLDPYTTYYYVVRAVNDRGAASLSNEASATTYSDVTPPTVPGNLKVTGVTRHSVLLGWEASTDDIGVKNYEIYVNQQKAFITANTEFEVSGLDSFTNYSFYVVAVDMSGNKSAPTSQVNAFTKRTGLNYSIYLGSWNNLPDFSVLQPELTGIHKNISLDVSPFEDYFGMVWEGWIQIPTDGQYIFYLASDDGSKMYLGDHYAPGLSPLIDNDGLHGIVEKNDTINLTAGAYKLAVTFFEKTGGQSLTLKWKRPGGTKQTIPDMYFGDGETSSGTNPAKPTAVAATALAYNRVNLSWADNSSNETGFEIYRKGGADVDYVVLARTGMDITSYSDSLVSGSTIYTYRVQAVNDNGVSGYTGSAVVTTPAAPPVPPIPQNLTVTPVSPTSVTISFTGSGHTGFEIQRSIGNDHQFRLYRSWETTETNISIPDTALFGNTIVYYKVKALGEAGNSDFTTPVFVTTLNSSPQISELGTRYIYYAGTSVIPVVATDADGDALSLTATNLPPFATFTPTENGKGNLTFNTDINDLGSYTIHLAVDDGFGGTDNKTLELIVTTNRPPAFGRVRDIDIIEGESSYSTVSAVDPDRRSSLRYSLSGEPSFVSGRDAENSFIFNFRPGYGEAGVYEFNLIANDGNGGLDSVLIRLNVAKAKYGDKILMNIMNVNPAPAEWNNLTVSNVANLKDESGTPTSVGIFFTPTNFNTSKLGTSTGNQSGVFPDEVMQDNYYFGSPGLSDTVYFTLNGLDINKRYLLSVFASSSYSGGSTVYETGGQRRSISVRDNVSEKATFNSLTPALDGTIRVKLYKGDTTPIGYLNAIVLQEIFDDGTRPKAPAEFTATPLPNGDVSLTWKNQAYNAEGYTLLRSETIDGVYTEVGQHHVHYDDTVYIDKSVDGNLNYYYKLFAYNAYGNSDTAGIAHAGTVNRLPVLQPINDVFMKAGTTRVINVVSVDSDGETLTLDVSGLPAFANFQVTGNGTGTITIQPTNGNRGTYKNITVISKDNFGGSTSLAFDLSVAEEGVKTIRINFNGNAGAPYNDYNANPNPYYTMTGLVDELNTPTTAAFKFLTTLYGKSPYGMVYGNDGVVPDAVLSAGMSVVSTEMQQFQFTGLDANKKYNIGILSSYNTGLTSMATFSSGGKSVDVNGRFNTNKIPQLNGLTPSTEGVIVVNFIKSSATTTFILNALKLEEYDPGTLLSPANVMAEPMVDEKSVLLNWSDRTDGETGFEIYRSSNPDAGFVLVASTGPDVTTFTDDASMLSPGATYYYRIKTITASGSSEFSNAVKFSLSASKSLVNMNVPGINGPSPWNNINSAGGAKGDGISNLKNTQDVSTGVTFTITNQFSARGFDGILTGVLPPLVMQTDFFTDAGLVSEVTFSGLDLRKVYRVGVMSSVDRPSGQFFGNYTINGVMKQINSFLNDSKMIYFGDIAPDENGEISISITPQLGWSPYCFTNAFTLESYVKPVDGLPEQGFFTNQSLTSGIVAAAPAKRGGEAKVRAPQVLSMTAYPNPFVSQFRIEIDLPANSFNATLEMYDIHSRLIFKKDVGDKSGVGGRKLLTLPVVQELAPGVYTLKLTVDNEFKTFKLVKAK